MEIRCLLIGDSAAWGSCFHFPSCTLVECKYRKHPLWGFLNLKKRTQNISVCLLICISVSMSVTSSSVQNTDAILTQYALICIFGSKCMQEKYFKTVIENKFLFRQKQKFNKNCILLYSKYGQNKFVHVSQSRFNTGASSYVSLICFYVTQF